MLSVFFSYKYHDSMLSVIFISPKVNLFGFSFFIQGSVWMWICVWHTFGLTLLVGSLFLLILCFLCVCVCMFVFGNDNKGMRWFSTLYKLELNWILKRFHTVQTKIYNAFFKVWWKLFFKWIITMYFYVSSIHAGKILIDSATTTTERWHIVLYV